MAPALVAFWGNWADCAALGMIAPACSSAALWIFDRLAAFPTLACGNAVVCVVTTCSAVYYGAASAAIMSSKSATSQIPSSSHAYSASPREGSVHVCHITY